jgi:hypothetical protein
VAQQAKVVVGRVVDAASGAPLPDAVIHVIGPDVAIGAASGASGRFAIEVSGADVRLVANRLGFLPETLSVAIGGPTTFPTSTPVPSASATRGPCRPSTSRRSTRR